MNGSTPGHLLHFVTRRLRLRRYLKNPGDGRPQPQIPAQALLWALLIGQILRQSSFHAVEALVRSSARRTLAIPIPFSDDTLGYFTERLDPRPTRQALLALLRSAKRNKAFDDCRWIGLALDGTGAGWRAQHGCNLCRPKQNAAKQVLGYQHSFVMISVVGTGLSLPCDGEPYGPGDSEYAAGQRLLRRVIGNLGKRFAQYVVVDGEFATAPFLHTAGQLGLRVVARLKDNLPELLAAAGQRFPSASPTTVFQHGLDRVEVWDAEDFDPWNTLRWEMVRVFFYRQHKPDGKVVEAYWLTNFPSSTVGPQALFRMAKSRWEIGVSREGYINQSVRVRPRPKDSGLVAWEAPRKGTKAVKPSDNMLRKEYTQHTRLQRTVNADVASLHENPVAETVDNARKQQKLTEMSPKRQLSPAGYQRRHGVKVDVPTGEALGARRRNLAEEALAITLSGKCERRHQGDGSGRSTVDERAAKHARRKGPGPVSAPFVKVRQG